MKVHDSGMPEESYWNSLFDIPKIVKWLNLQPNFHMAEIGCGYGTFTVPIAQQLTKGQLHSFDIEKEMLATTQYHLNQANISNVKTYQTDILDNGSGLTDNNIDMVLLFNILHFEERALLLREAARILKPGGIIAIIHWRKDIKTPRGPSIALRPDFKDIKTATAGLSLSVLSHGEILPPFHWGIQLSSPTLSP